jgi:glycosyltransferase involved in cell wall biosynthesis
MSKNILFVGSFLSKLNGTKGISESLQDQLKRDDLTLKLVSKFSNKWLRMLDIVFSVLIYSGTKVHIDIFSGPAFRIAEIASFISVIKKKKIIMTLHGGKLIEFYQQNEKRIQRVFNRAFLIQTPSKFLQTFFIKKDFSIDYLPNSIDLLKFPMRTGSITESKILWVRAFTTIYNPEVPIHVLNQILKLHPTATLTLIGPDKGCQAEIEELVKELGLSGKVEFVGSVKNEELYKYYQSHRVFLNTTSYESFGVSVMEAAACGLPIISNTVGEIPYLWEDGINILLVKNNNIDEYCQHIDKLFRDQGFGEFIVLNARKKAEEFDWENVKHLWLNALS